MDSYRCSYILLWVCFWSLSLSLDIVCYWYFIYSESITWFELSDYISYLRLTCGNMGFPLLKVKLIILHSTLLTHALSFFSVFSGNFASQIFWDIFYMPVDCWRLERVSFQYKDKLYFIQILIRKSHLSLTICHDHQKYPDFWEVLCSLYGPIYCLLTLFIWNHSWPNFLS